VGDRCTISLRLPRFYSKVETETGAAERTQRPRLRVRRRPRAA
jgi:hypothetical protein